MNDKIEKTLSEAIANKNLAAGNDLVFLPNFKNSLTDEFIAKVYTKNEIAYCELFDDSLLRYASTWAAKEAVYKALKQLSVATLGWSKIEITREKIAGKPGVVLHQYLNQPAISLTISHDGEYVWAIALIGK